MVELILTMVAKYSGPQGVCVQARLNKSPPIACSITADVFSCNLI